jgi:hypothetical protein
MPRAATAVVPVVQEREHTFQPNGSRTVMHVAVQGDNVLLITRESGVEPELVGCFRFGCTYRLQDTRIFRLKQREATDTSFLYAFGQGQDTVIVGKTTAFSFSPTCHYMWVTKPSGTSLSQPRLVVQDKKCLPHKWWLLNVGKGRKLFVLKRKYLAPPDAESDPKSEDGWLHCYNLTNGDRAELESFVRIESDTTKSYWVECAAFRDDVYIWQTIHHKDEFSERKLRVAQWPCDGKLHWTTYQTTPQVSFAVDHSDGSTALVMEQLVSAPSEAGVRKSDIDISFARAGFPKLTKIGSFPGHGMLRSQLLRTTNKSYPWAGLVAPFMNSEMLILRATDQYKAVSGILARPFDIRDIALLSKGDELLLFRVSRDKISLKKVQDFWTK